MNDVKETIRHCILQNYLPSESRESLRDDTPLQSSGILDSLALLSLVTFVEKEFSIELNTAETLVESFDRTEDIAALVIRKQDGAKPTRLS
jgi:acyl carrier protein